MRVTIIMPVYNNLLFTKEAVESIKETAEDYDLLIVDDGSTDGTAEWLKEQGVDHITHEENKGYTKSVNDGILTALSTKPREWKTKYVCVVNNDVVFSPGWLKQLVDSCEERGLFCAWPAYTHGLTIPKKMPKAVDWVNLIKRGKQPNTHKSFARAPTMITGHCFMVNTEVFDYLGYLDESLKMVFSDYDFYNRLNERGIPTGPVLNAHVHHLGQRTVDKMPGMQEIIDKDVETYCKKNPGLCTKIRGKILPYGKHKIRFGIEPDKGRSGKGREKVEEKKDSTTTEQ